MSMVEYMLLKVTENKHNYKLKDLLDNDIKFRESYTYDVYNDNDIFIVGDEILIYKEDIDINLDGFRYTLNLIENNKISSYIYKIRKEMIVKVGNLTLNINDDNASVFFNKADHYVNGTLILNESLVMNIRKELNMEYYTLYDFINKVLMDNTNIILNIKLFKLTDDIEYREIFMSPVFIKKDFLRLPMILPLRLNLFKVSSFKQ